MKKFIVIMAVLSFSFFTKGQDSQYIYKRNSEETAEQFVNKYFDSDNYTYGHDVIEGYWGDESKGQKIMAILDSPIIEEYDRATLLVFQPVGDGENYILIPSNDIGGVGVYLSSVLSVFFYDLDDDNIKELFIIEHGEMRADVVIEVEDENGEITEEHTTACCDDIYETTVLKQKKKYTNDYLPLLENITYDSQFEHLDLSGLETAADVKARIEAFKNK